jgi:nitrate/nitrite transport system substrate-binding protein
MRMDGLVATTVSKERVCVAWMATLTFTLCFAALLLTSVAGARAEPLVPEKDELKLGFIKLTDMAPLAIAKELGFFEEEGLYVTLEPQANWKVLLDRVISGELDGAHMLAGQPIAATIGFGTKAEIVTPFSMDLNGNAVTVSNDVWAMMKPNIPVADGKPAHPI